MFRNHKLAAAVAAGVLAVAVALAQPSPPARQPAKAQPTARPKAAPVKAAPVKAAPASPAEIRQALERSFTLTGTATRAAESGNFGMQSGSWQRWTLDLNAVNGTPYRVRFGNDLLLVEASAESVNFDGVWLTIGGEARSEAERWSLFTQAADGRGSRRTGDYYGLSNYERRHVDGSTLQVKGNTISISFPAEDADGTANKGPDVRDFGSLAPKGARAFKLPLDEGTWVKLENLTSVRVVLPELTVTAGGAAERFRVVYYFDRPAGDAKAWKAARQEVIHIEAGELGRLITVPEGNQVTRILAANWLADLAPQKAGEALTSMAQTLRQGQLLATAFLLLRDARMPGLETHALALLKDSENPNGIRRLAALYLGSLRQETAVDALVTATKETDEPVALAAIAALGDLGSATAVDPLLTIVRDDKASSKRQTAAAKSLAQTDLPAALSSLMSLAAAGNETAIDALVEKSPPSCFDFFLEQLRGGTHEKWRDRLLTGLRKANPDRALPILMEMLAAEAPPDKKDPTSRTQLVTEIINLKATKSIPELMQSARAGNLRACQVLAGTKDELFRKALLEFAMEAKGDAQWIAVHGLSSNWTNSGADAYKRVLAQPERPQTIELAARGLEKLKDPEIGSRLAALLASGQPAVALAGAQAINRLKATTTVPDLLPAFLATSDGKTAEVLAQTMLERKWEERRAIPQLAARLKGGPEDVRYPVILLLRRLSKDAIGPQYSFEFDKDKAGWTEKWIQWAEAQPEHRRL